MKFWKEDIEYFCKKRIYWMALAMTAVFGYGYLITHATVGIDDTPYKLYFTDGMAAYVGRWVVFLLGKVLHIADFAPFLTDLFGVLLLAAAAVVFSILMHHILRDSVPFYGYLFFACFLAANPLWAEVFVYFLHNGLGLGYLLLGVSLCCLIYGEESKKKRGYLFSGVFLWMAIGCYESTMVAWLVGFLMVMLAKRYQKTAENVIWNLVKGAAVMVGAMVLRTVWIPIIKGIFHLEEVSDGARTRALSEMASWVTDAQQRAEFIMAIKRAYVMYGVFAFAYYPIFLFVLAAAVIVLSGVVFSIRRKEGWTVFLSLSMLLSCFLLIPIEGKVTLYRSAQFLPIVCAFGVILFTRVLEGLSKHIGGEITKEAGRGLCRILQGAAVVILSIFLCNQCADLNHWFYVDDLKYEAAKETAGRISYELEKGFDLSKPVIFTGIYEIPAAIIQDAYVPYGTKTFARMDKLCRMVDPHLLEKFYRRPGVWVAQAPTLSVIEWGREAFDNNKELANFFAMHGHFFLPVMELDKIEAAKQYAVEAELPGFPAEGSIVDMGDYILVNF